MHTEKISVLFLITKGNLGGAQKYVFDLASSLPLTRFEPIVACGEGALLEHMCKEKGIPTTHLASVKSDLGVLDLRALVDVYKLIKEDKPNILHLNSSKIGFIGGLAGRLYNIAHRQNPVKIIFTAHGWAFNDARYGVLTREIFRVIQWWSVLLSHKTIAVSKAIKNEMNFPFAPKKISVIQNGIGMIDFVDKETARKKLVPESHKSELWLGTISELTKNKGVDNTLRAFARIAKEFPQARFIVIGEGEERENLENLIKNLDITNQVHLLGFIPDASRYLKAMDIFILTSRTEALGFVLLEAGMASIPPIASRVGGIPEIIENTVSGILVRPNNIKEVETALRFLFEHEEKRHLMGEHLYTSVSSKFSFEKMLNDTIEIYRSVS